MTHCRNDTVRVLGILQYNDSAIDVFEREPFSILVKSVALGEIMINMQCSLSASSLGGILGAAHQCLHPPTPRMEENDGRRKSPEIECSSVIIPIGFWGRKETVYTYEIFYKSMLLLWLHPQNDFMYVVLDAHGTFVTTPTLATDTKILVLINAARTTWTTCT